VIPAKVFEKTLLSFFAPIRPYLDDPTVSEIMINGPDRIYVERGGVLSLVDARFDGAISRVTSLDSFIPLGDAALLVLVSEQAIERAAFAVLG